MTNIYSIIIILVSLITPDTVVETNIVQPEIIINKTTESTSDNMLTIDLYWAPGVSDSRKAEIRQELKDNYGKSPLEGYYPDGKMIWKFNLDNIANSVLIEESPRGCDNNCKTGIITGKVEDLEEVVPD